MFYLAPLLKILPPPPEGKGVRGMGQNALKE